MPYDVADDTIALEDQQARGDLIDKERSWLTTTTAPGKFTSARSITWVLVRSRWLVGSSRKSTFAPESRHCASATRARCPPDKRADRLFEVQLGELQQAEELVDLLARGQVRQADHVDRVRDGIVEVQIGEDLVVVDVSGIRRPRPRAVVRLFAAGQNAQQGGLAAAVRPEDGDAVAPVDLEGNILEQARSP